MNKHFRRIAMISAFVIFAVALLCVTMFTTSAAGPEDGNPHWTNSETPYIAYAAPTCTEDGQLELWLCYHCHEYFADKECTEPMTLAESVIPTPGHDMSEATCTAVSSCTVCGYSEDDAELAPHDMSEATCTAVSACTVCGFSEEGATTAPHDFTVYVTCDTPYLCSVCGAEDSENAGHIWGEATCITAKTCQRKSCNQTTGSPNGHAFVQATCTAPKTCAVCSATSGAALGHDWAAATCTEPETCKTCKATSTPALGHNLLAATCTEPKRCAACDYTEGKSLGHDWPTTSCLVQSSCTRCAKDGVFGTHTDADADQYCDLCHTSTGEATALTKVVERNVVGKVFLIIGICLVGLAALFALYWFLIRRWLKKVWLKFLDYIANL